MASAGIEVAGLVPESITDGPGLRFTVFCQGCPHHCFECHNPETWPFEGGTFMSAEEIFAQVQKNPLLKGVTFSGGEPMCQAEGFCALARLLKQSGYEVAVYSGYTFEELYENGTPAQKELLFLCDVLVDGPFVLSLRNLDLAFRGSSNQRLVNLPESLSAGRAVLITAPRWTGEPVDF